MIRKKLNFIVVVSLSTASVMATAEIKEEIIELPLTYGIVREMQDNLKFMKQVSMMAVFHKIGWAELDDPKVLENVSIEKYFAKLNEVFRVWEVLIPRVELYIANYPLKDHPEEDFAAMVPSFEQLKKDLASAQMVVEWLMKLNSMNPEVLKAQAKRAAVAAAEAGEDYGKIPLTTIDSWLSEPVPQDDESAASTSDLADTVSSTAS